MELQPNGNSPHAFFVTLGTARLPKTLSGEAAGVLSVELSLDAEAGQIVHVDSTIALPGYTAVLRSLLVGRRLDEVECCAQRLRTQLRGPLLKPTIAALASAVVNATAEPVDIP